MEMLEQTLAQYPILLEIPTLERLASGVLRAAEQPDAARQLLAWLGILLEQTNQAHAERVDLAEQSRLVALHESLLPPAAALDAELLAGLRISLVGALNILGNAYAEQEVHEAAVEAYSRALVHAPENAMLYRNRAGEHLKLQQWAAAEADIIQAVALEPDAPRLQQLRESLARRPQD